MKAWYSQNLWKLCQRGEYQSAVSSVKEMVSRGYRLTHFDCSALLYGSIECRKPEHHHWIWNQLMNEHSITPNVVTYSLAIAAASRCHHTQTVHQLAHEMRNLHGPQMDHKTWNQLLDSLGRINDIDGVMDALSAMKVSGCDPDSCTMTTVLSGCIRSQRFDVFESVLTEILSSDHSIKSLVDHHVMVTILDGTLKSGDPELVDSRWSRIVDTGFIPNANCYGSVILALSKMKDRNRAIETVTKNVMTMKREHAHNLSVDGGGHQLWHQILLSYSNLEMYDEMWLEYDEMKSMINPNAVTFSILVHRGNGDEDAMRALKEAKKCGLKWNECSHRELKGFWRIAERLGDTQLIKELRPILEMKKENVGVEAVIDELRFDNFYGSEKADILQAVDDLIRKCGHTVDVGQHFEIDNESAETLIRYHAEKKALAFALSKGIDNKITIRVSLRMCGDCHRFFRAVTMQPEYSKLEIIVYDSKTKHCFKHGECSCDVNNRLYAQFAR